MIFYKANLQYAIVMFVTLKYSTSISIYHTYIVQRYSIIIFNSKDGIYFFDT